MYLPKSFEESDAAAKQAFIRQHPLATLITSGDEGLCADHIPMLTAANDASGLRLQGHVARANPIWQRIDERSEILAIFQDPGRYITPSWYATKSESQRVVPTWNYIAVHAYGEAMTFKDPVWLRNFLARLTEEHESGRPLPWTLSDAPHDYVTTQLAAIVGIEIRVSRLVGKWKMSQNRSPKDIDGVIAGLEETGQPCAQRMADEIRRRRRLNPTG
jgi:transcriptional regulator